MQVAVNRLTTLIDIFFSVDQTIRVTWTIYHAEIKNDLSGIFLPPCGREGLLHMDEKLKVKNNSKQPPPIKKRKKRKKGTKQIKGRKFPLIKK